MYPERSWSREFFKRCLKTASLVLTLLGLSACFQLTSILQVNLLSAEEKGAFTHTNSHQISQDLDVVAIVNDEPIFMKELRGGTNSLQSETIIDEKVLSMRFERLIHFVMLEQFLADKKIAVKENTVTEEIGKLKKNPPMGMGSPYKRYPSLDDYMKINFMTENELRRSIRIDKGIFLYLTGLWKKEQQRDNGSAMSAEIQDIKSKYSKVYHILFAVADSQGAANDPNSTAQTQKDRAELVREGLLKGESFGKLAKEVSDDEVSREEGGFIGILLNQTNFDKKLSKALQSLKPGEISEPVLSDDGYHIITREPLSEEDIKKFLETRFFMKTQHELLHKIRSTAKIERKLKFRDSGEREDHHDHDHH